MGHCLAYLTNTEGFSVRNIEEANNVLEGRNVPLRF